MRTPNYKNDILKALGDSVNKALNAVSKKDAPRVYEYLRSSKGRFIITQMMIGMICTENLTPAECIPHIESELE